MIRPGSSVCNRILVWPITVDESPAQIQHWWHTLSAEERARAQRFRRPGDCDRWVVAHGVLRRILGHLANCEPARITFATEKRGKPRIVEPISASCWHFNLSHSHRMALVGVTRVGPLGLDIEYVREFDNMHGVARRVFAGSERSDLMSLHGRGRASGFYNGWTRKESLIKATGAGMSQSLKSIEVSLIPGEPAVVRAFEEDDPAAWQLHSLDVATDYAAAVAIRTDRAIDTEVRSHEAID